MDKYEKIFKTDHRDYNLDDPKEKELFKLRIARDILNYVNNLVNKTKDSASKKVLKK